MAHGPMVDPYGTKTAFLLFFFWFHNSLHNMVLFQRHPLIDCPAFTARVRCVVGFKWQTNPSSVLPIFFAFFSRIRWIGSRWASGFYRIILYNFLFIADICSWNSSFMHMITEFEIKFDWLRGTIILDEEGRCQIFKFGRDSHFWMHFLTIRIAIY